jgi:hypothetical protein
MSKRRGREMNDSTMGNRPRDYLAIEDDFCRSRDIISVRADLPTSVDERKRVLADDTLEKLGIVCFREIQNIRAMFYELVESQKAAR